MMLISFFNNIFSPVLRGRPSSKRSIHICGRPRWVFVLFFSAGLQKLDFVNAIFHQSSKLTPIVFVIAVSCMLWLTSCSLLTVLWALLIALFGMASPWFLKSMWHVQCPYYLFCCAATVLHASFRTPNLKARLNTFREEFRAVWRNYSEL